MPPLKRQKVDIFTATPRLTSLARSSLSLPAYPSPGSQHSCRVALQVGAAGGACDVFFATGGDVYSCNVDLKAAAAANEGKEGVYLPFSGTALESQKIEGMLHCSEVQSLEFVQHQDHCVLASVDAYGRGIVRRTSKAQDEGRAVQMYTLQPASHLSEGGWAGVACDPHATSSIAVTRQFCRDVTVFDGEVALRCLSTMHCPTHTKWLGHGGQGPANLLVSAQGPQVVVYDIRAGERGGCVQRLSAGPGNMSIFALACHAEDEVLVAGGGADRTVTVWDSRKWSIRDHWVNALKYEIMSLHFSPINPAFVYVSGLDYEVLCGRWSQSGKKGGGMRSHADSGGSWVSGGSGRGVSWRGDSRWLGLAVGGTHDTDVLAGFSSQGSLYLAQLSAS